MSKALGQAKVQEYSVVKMNNHRGFCVVDRKVVEVVFKNTEIDTEVNEHLRTNLMAIPYKSRIYANSRYPPDSRTIAL